MTDVGSLFDQLRVSDVRDGMDWAGLHGRGSVSPEIAPMFQGARLHGPAHTMRHRLSEKVVPPMSPEEYTAWAYSYWYQELYSYPLEQNLTGGEVVVVESPPDVAVGEIGSNNSLSWYAAGAAGIVTSGDVLVRPGDIIVADGDGVIAVPIEHAEVVAKYARQELEKDKAGRRRLYEKLGWQLDETVR